MLILDKLWNGELDLAGRSMGDRPGYSQCLHRVSQAKAELMGGLTPEGKACFGNYEESQSELAGFLERDAFFAGFRTGGLLMLDLLQGMESQ